MYFATKKSVMYTHYLPVPSGRIFSPTKDITRYSYKFTSNISHWVESVVRFIGKALDGWPMSDRDDAIVSRRH